MNDFALDDPWHSAGAPVVAALWHLINGIALSRPLAAPDSFTLFSSGAVLTRMVRLLVPIQNLALLLTQRFLLY
jgi:hypothetical protein